MDISFILEENEMELGQEPCLVYENTLHPKIGMDDKRLKEVGR